MGVGGSTTHASLKMHPPCKKRGCLSSRVENGEFKCFCNGALCVLGVFFCARWEGRSIVFFFFFLTSGLRRCGDIKGGTCVLLVTVSSG